MPTLFERLRTEASTLTEAIRSLQDEMSSAPEITEDMEARMRDLESQLAANTPRLSSAADVERRIASTTELLARAPVHSVPGTGYGTVEPSALYRDAGSYLVDYVAARQGDRNAADRLTAYKTRAPANQTTADNPGVVPDPIVGTVLSWIDAQRPVVEALGIRTLPAYPTFYRPNVTQHTSVAAQTAEKTELASRKMLINRLTVTAQTYGGYVDLSLQDRDFTNPAIMGILIDDLAGQYAIATEIATSINLAGGVTANVTTPTLDWADVSAAIFAAAGTVYGASARMPNVVLASVDVWGALAPGFYGIPNPVGTGFTAAGFGGTYAGLRLVVGPQLPDGTAIVGSTSGFEVYEQRVGTLQALEVSLLGIQVGYAGFFAGVMVNAGAFCKITMPTIPGAARGGSSSSAPSSSSSTSTASGGK